jgi:hypothetical protein
VTVQVKHHHRDVREVQESIQTAWTPWHESVPHRCLVD